MKRYILFTAALFLAASGALAQPPQLEKGKIMLGVTSTASMSGSWGSDMLSLGFLRSKHKSGSNTYNEDNMRTFSLLPKGGYFIMDNLSVGLESILAGSSRQHADSEGKYTETTIAIGPVVRYYYPLEKIYPFAEIEAIFGSVIDKWPTSGSTEDVYRYSISMAGLSLGAAVPIGDKVTFDMTAGYTRIVWKEKEDNEEDFSEIYVGPTVRMGFTIYL
jgi:hypothetical protein